MNHITENEIEEVSGKMAVAITELLNRSRQPSELAQEIISRKPDFFERWALYIFLGILFIICGATFFIKYPDIVESRAILTVRNSPKEIITKTDGRLIKIFVHNNQYVKKNTMIGWMESTANHQEVLGLSNQVNAGITAMNDGHFENVARLFDRYFFNLGELQGNYQQFITTVQQFKDSRANGFSLRRKRSLENDLSSIAQTKIALKAQRKLTEQDLSLAGETYKMNKHLSDERVITKEEDREQTSRYLNKQMAVPQLDALIISNESQKRDKEKEIDQIDHDILQQQIVFQQALQSLKSQLDEWTKMHILYAPVDGRVSFTVSLQENQYLPSGRLLGYVNPTDSHLYASTYLPQNNFGKVHVGLPVQLRFSAYPYQEIGFVEGHIEYISNVPSDSGFFATIKLDRGLLTNTHRHIPYKNGLKSQALIITKDMKLSDRLYFSIIKSVSVDSK